MANNMTLPSTKKRKYQEVVNVKFNDSHNVLELIYDSKVKGCKSVGHTQKRCDRFYVIPCKKTLNEPYFKNIFFNESARIGLAVLEK